MWIMIAGPYSSNDATPEGRARNLAALNRVALAVFDRGHVPVIGLNLALPLAALAPDRAAEVVMPLSLALVERCDACLRVGGASTGADAEVAAVRAAAQPGYMSLDDLPAVTAHPDGA
jgi:hypothetical protein